MVLHSQSVAWILCSTFALPFCRSWTVSPKFADLLPSRTHPIHRLVRTSFLREIPSFRRVKINSTSKDFSEACAQRFAGCRLLKNGTDSHRRIHDLQRTVFRLSGGARRHGRTPRSAKMNKNYYLRNVCGHTYQFKHGRKYAGYLKAREKWYVTNYGRWAKKRPGWDPIKVYGKNPVDIIMEELAPRFPKYMRHRQYEARGAGSRWLAYMQKRSLRRTRMMGEIREREKEEKDKQIQREIDRIEGKVEREEMDDTVAELDKERAKVEEEAAKRKEEERLEALKQELKGTIFDSDEEEMGGLTTEDESED
ncbi:hypothetical protein AAMO2058_001047400 [Amorphochlora amoebiformis]